MSSMLTLSYGIAQKNPTEAIPIKKDNIYSIRIQSVELEADPATGGRIISLKLNERNFLTGKDINALYWGSTFWASPQKVWDSPNMVPLDREAYSGSIENNVIKMISEKDPKTGFVFLKEITGDTRQQSFTIKYSILNKSDSVKKVAPWEVTRVYPEGLTFYPHGSSKRWGNMADLAVDQDGITWFDYRKDSIQSRHNKFFADGAEGWIAHLNENVIFIKKFPDMPIESAAPSEAEVEVYTNPQKSYVEIEQQGRYQELKPASSLNWEVTWYLRKLPANIKPQQGNPALVNYVRNVLNIIK